MSVPLFNYMMVKALPLCLSTTSWCTWVWRKSDMYP